MHHTCAFRPHFIFIYLIFNSNPVIIYPNNVYPPRGRIKETNVWSSCTWLRPEPRTQSIEIIIIIMTFPSRKAHYSKVVKDSPSTRTVCHESIKKTLITIKYLNAKQRTIKRSLKLIFGSFENQKGKYCNMQCDLYNFICLRATSQ
jgi:hypothetical protein